MYHVPLTWPTLRHFCPTKLITAIFITSGHFHPLRRLQPSSSKVGTTHPVKGEIQPPPSKGNLICDYRWLNTNTHRNRNKNPQSYIYVYIYISTHTYWRKIEGFTLGSDLIVETISDFIYYCIKVDSHFLRV